MAARQQYVDDLPSTPVYSTGANLAAQSESIHRGTLGDDLQRERHTTRHLQELAQPLIAARPTASLLVDDRVQDKRYSRTIDLVKRQWVRRILLHQG